MNIPREAMKLKKRMYELSRGSPLPVTILTDFFVVNFVINHTETLVNFYCLKILSQRILISCAGSSNLN